MSKFHLAGNEYALGLSWVEITGSKVASEAESISKDTNKEFGAIYTSKLSGLTQVGLTDDPDTKGAEAGAAVLLQVADESSVLIEKLNNDKYWVCAISSGKIIIGGDKVLSLQDAQEHINELYSLYQEAEDEVFVYVSESTAAEFSFFFSEDKIVYADFASLIDDYESDEGKKLVKFKIKGFKGKPRSAYLFVAFVVLASGMLYQFMQPEEVIEDYYEPLPISDAALRAEEEKREAIILQNAYDEEVSWLQDDLSKKDPLYISRQILDFSAKLPQHIGGWSASSITYIDSMPEHLSVRWEKEEGGTTLTLKHSINANVSFNLSGPEAISQHAVIKPSNRRYDDLIKFIKDEKYKHIEIMHDVESLKYEWKMSNHVNGARVVPIQGIKDAQLAQTKQLNLVAKDFSISGLGLYSLSNIGFILEKAKTSKINEFTISLKDDYMWTINGVIYEN